VLPLMKWFQQGSELNKSTPANKPLLRIARRDLL